MPRLTLVGHGPLILGSRLTPTVGPGPGPAVAAHASLMPDESGAAVTRADTLHDSGRLILAVAVAARCPACLLRAEGVVRLAGGGVTEARFPVRPGAREVDIEMA